MLGVYGGGLALPGKKYKDALLQENGYFVLRFLAEDVGRQLDSVLNVILRAMAHGKRVPDH